MRSKPRTLFNRSKWHPWFAWRPVRFHHRLVSVHPFPNGNGRWSRLEADVLISQLGGARFTWGGANLQASGDARKRYIEALQAADKHDLEPPIRFARF